MKQQRSIGKKIVKNALVREAKKKVVTENERMRAELLLTRQAYWQEKLGATNEARAFAQATQEIAIFEKQLVEKYGVTPPFDIQADGTIVSAPSG